MKAVAKWVVIGWSLLCLLGVISGLASVGQKMDTANMTEAEQAGAGLGAGCGMAMWVGIWLAIAGPAFIIYAVSGNPKPDTQVTRTGVPTLCKDCGKYYEGPSAFCSHCGKPTTVG